MKIVFYSPVHFERWDWRNSVEQGIGGSETSHVEMAWRLARRGHEVLSYAPIPDDCPGEWRGTFWKRLEEADFSQDGLWVLYRCPDVLDRFGPTRPDQPRWLMCQDEDYPTWTPERAAKIDRVLALCGSHAGFMRGRHPELADRIWVTSNGVKVDLIREVEAEGVPARNPRKLIYASSPDRGLLQALLPVFRRAREIVPDLELHVFYGLDNIKKLIEFGKEDGKPSRFAHYEKLLMDLEREVARTPGVTWRGRVDQWTLYREWLSAGLWVYPTQFTETSCITSMEAQALGAIPICSPLWALAENVAHGVVIEGHPYLDPLIRARFVGAIVTLTREGLKLQDEIRGPMMKHARERFNWERWVDQWECALLGWPVSTAVQFMFQHKWLKGRALNVGCDTDPSGLRRHRGAVNLDVRETSPITGQPTAYDVLHDVREPLPACLGTFDSVVLGDILEHLSARDGVQALKTAKAALRPGGHVVLTVPDDAGRTPSQQHGAEVQGDEEYAPGVSAFHTRGISERTLRGMLRVAGLTPVVWQPIDYTHFMGHGVVAVPT